MTSLDRHLRVLATPRRAAIWGHLHEVVARRQAHRVVVALQRITRVILVHALVERVTVRLAGGEQLLQREQQRSTLGSVPDREGQDSSFGLVTFTTSGASELTFVQTISLLNSLHTPIGFQVLLSTVSIVVQHTQA